MTVNYLDSLPSHDLVIYTNGSVLFLFGKEGSSILTNRSLCGAEAILSYSAAPECSSFSVKYCAILLAFRWTRQHQQDCQFFSFLFLSNFRFILETLLSFLTFLLSQALWHIWQELSFLSSYFFINLQWVPVYSFVPVNDALDELARQIRCFNHIQFLSSFTSYIHFFWRRAVSSIFVDTQIRSVFIAKLVLPFPAGCVLSRLCSNRRILLLNFDLFRIGSNENL